AFAPRARGGRTSARPATVWFGRIRDVRRGRPHLSWPTRRPLLAPPALRGRFGGPDLRLRPMREPCLCPDRWHDEWSTGGEISLSPEPHRIERSRYRRNNDQQQREDTNRSSPVWRDFDRQFAWP